MRGFCVLDVETVNFKPHRDNVWAISGIKVVNRVVESVFDSLVKPPSPHWAREFYKASGLKPEDFEGAAPIQLVAEKAYDFFKGFDVYAYSASFDKRMLIAVNPVFGKLTYKDYLPIVKKKKPGLKNYKLGTVANHLRLPHRKNGYDSLNDCYVLLDLIKRLGL